MSFAIGSFAQGLVDGMERRRAWDDRKRQTAWEEEDRARRIAAEDEDRAYQREVRDRQRAEWGRTDAERARAEDERTALAEAYRLSTEEAQPRRITGPAAAKEDETPGLTPEPAAPPPAADTMAAPVPESIAPRARGRVMPAPTAMTASPTLARPGDAAAGPGIVRPDGGDAATRRAGRSLRSPEAPAAPQAPQRPDTPPPAQTTGGQGRFTLSAKATGHDDPDLLVFLESADRAEAAIRSGRNPETGAPLTPREADLARTSVARAEEWISRLAAQSQAQPVESGPQPEPADPGRGPMPVRRVTVGEAFAAAPTEVPQAIAGAGRRIIDGVSGMIPRAQPAPYIDPTRRQAMAGERAALEADVASSTQGLAGQRAQPPVQRPGMDPAAGRQIAPPQPQMAALDPREVQFAPGLDGDTSNPAGPQNGPPAAPNAAPGAQMAPDVSPAGAATTPTPGDDQAVLADAVDAASAAPSVQTTAPAVERAARAIPMRNASPKVIERAGEKASQTAWENYRTVGVEYMVDFYMQRGEIEKAQAFREFAAQEGTQAAIRSWTRAQFSAVIGDDSGFVSHLADAYSAAGYFDDGFELVREETRLFRDQNGEFTGAQLAFRNIETGQVFVQPIRDAMDFYAAGIGILAPEKVFEWQQSQMTAAQDRLAEAVKAAEERGYKIDEQNWSRFKDALDAVESSPEALSMSPEEKADAALRILRGYEARFSGGQRPEVPLAVSP